MDIHKLPIGRIIAIIIVLALAAGCAWVYWDYRHSALEDAANATGVQKFGFCYNGEVYAYNGAGNYTFLRKLGNDTDYTILPGDTVRWSDSIGKFVFSDGKKVKTCDINGENVETLYKFSNARTVVVSDVIGDYALISGAYKSGTSYTPTGYRYLLNLKTGKSTETQMISGAYYQPLTISGNYMYYFRCFITEIRIDLYRCDITTGECELLIEKLPDYPSDGKGCVIGDYLYFNYSPSSGSGCGEIVRYSLEGGELETIKTDFKTGLLTEYNGQVLALSHTYAENEGQPILNVYTIDPETLEATKLGAYSTGDISSLEHLRLYDNLLVISGYRYAVAVELP